MISVSHLSLDSLTKRSIQARVGKGRWAALDGDTRMLFCSLPFFYFFSIVFCLYWVLPWQRVRVWLLLAASFYFYASWNKWLALIICVSTVMDYLLARAMETTSSQRWRFLLVAVSITANLGLLCYFKYLNFFLHSIEQTMHAMGSSSALPVLKVMLPVGISFYTFEAISYTIDVYQERIRAERNLLHFMLFITFFPHLVAGPIVRARDFLPQIRRIKRWNWMRLHLGVQLFLLGLFKKMVVADRMAAFADPVFADPSSYSRGAAWIAMIAYAMQVYCDFSGYSDMALGAAHMLGYKLTRNFHLPYLAANVAEFWRRWHMSLSSWLHDYLFFPLEFRHRFKPRTNRNLLLTMTLCGLWHGASWHFLFWGVLHGFLLIIHRAFRIFSSRRPVLHQALETRPGTALRIAVTFLSVCVAWVFFRATSFTIAVRLLHRLVGPHGGLIAPASVSLFCALAAITAMCHVLAERGVWQKLAPRLPPPVIGCGYAAVLVLALLLQPSDQTQFIYFQF
jgi:alginate O-acetyltransferase complex protein AlgI